MRFRSNTGNLLSNSPDLIEGPPRLKNHFFATERIFYANGHSKTDRQKKREREKERERKREREKVK